MNTDFKDQEEREINLLSMLLSLLKHWRSLLVILAIAIACGVVLPNLSKTEEQEILESQQRIESVYRYKQLIDKALEYIEESPYFQMDSNNVYVGTLKFSVAAEERTETIAQRFKSILSDADFIADVQAAYGQDVPWQYLRELASCSIERYEYSTEGADSLTVQVTDIVSLSITASNEAGCTAVLDVIRSYVEAVRSETVSGSEYTLLTDSVQTQVSSSVNSIRETKETELAEYQENYEEQYSALSETEQAIYESIYITGETDKETAFAEMEATGFGISIKYVVIAAILGAVVWAVWYAVPYLFSDLLRDNSEVGSICTLPVLACIRTEAKGTALDRWVQARWTNAFGPYQTEEYLCKVLAKDMEQGVTLSVNEASKAQKAVAEQVCAACAGLTVRPSYYSSAQSVAELHSGERVIVLVEIGATKRAELARELETLRRYGADIAGLVVID